MAGSQEVYKEGNQLKISAAQQQHECFNKNKSVTKSSLPDSTGGSDRIFGWRLRRPGPAGT
jgi:hypothetical protein